MATLSKVASRTKSVSKWIGVLILILIVIKIGGIIKERIFPTPQPPPTVAFGKLPAVNFPNNTVKRNFSYSIDTLTGILPSFSDRIPVYKIKSTKPDLLAFEKIKNMVSNLGFNSQSAAVSQDTYQWQDSDFLSRKIAINIFTSDFTLTSSFLSTPNTKPFNIDKNSALETAKTFLENMSLLPNDIDDTKTKVTFFYKKNYALVSTNDPSNTTDAKVDFFQSDVNKLPIYYPHPFTSTMNFVIENTEDKLEVVAANFVHQKISTNESATYPIKTADQAFSQLKSGKAYIVFYSGNANNILIKDVFLAYYIEEKRQDYLTPIVVFQGDNDFFAYVPAITDEWLSN